MIKFKVCFILIIISLTINIFGQTKDNCNCDEAVLVSEKLESSSSLPSNISINNLLKPLLNNKNLNCKINYYHFQVKLGFANQNLEQVEQNLISAEKLISKQNCLSLYIQQRKFLANLYNIKANYAKQLSYEIEILSLVENNGSRVEITNSLLNVAQTLNRINKPKDAIKYAKQASSNIKTIPDSAEKISVLNKASAAYLWYAQDFKDKNFLDSAKYFSTKALQLSKKYKLDKPQISALIRLNAIAQEENNLNQAIFYLSRAAALCDINTDIAQLASIYSDKANIFKLKKDYNQAKKFADSSLYFNLRFKYAPLIANSYHVIYEIEQARGDFKSALEAFKSEKNIIDSLNSKEQQTQVTELEQKYQKTKSEGIIVKLSQEQKISLLKFRLLAVISVSLFILAVLIFLALRQKSLKQKQVLLETEQRLNRVRINPHFFFNALTTLQGMILNQNDKSKAVTLIYSFSKIMRQTLESSYLEKHSINEEVNYLKEYLDLNLLDNPNKYAYNFNFENFNDLDEIEIPVMLIQPFVENAIEHGFSNISYLGKIDITFIKNDKNLEIKIRDNGKKSSKSNQNYTPRALQIIKDRLYLINQNNHQKANFNAHFSSSGAEVIINLPL
jgi:hypothetical protein